MSNYLATDTDLAAVADAIRTKGGTSAPLSFPSEYISAINAISGGGGSNIDFPNKVIFWDPLANDGEGGEVTSYDYAAFLALDSMPANPDHSNYTTHGISLPMTSQGWNWSLSDAKAYVTKYKNLVIGQVYVPTDGYTHLIVYVDSEDPNFMKVNTLSFNESNNVYKVDNGAETARTVGTVADIPTRGYHDLKLYNTNSETYYALYLSDYSISANERSTRTPVIGAYLGNKAYIRSECFSEMRNLKTITIPNPDAALISGNNNKISYGMCYNDDSVTNIVIPNGYAVIDTYAFYYCISMTVVSFPHTITSIKQYAFHNCNSLKIATLPDLLTTIENYAFQYCYSLEYITLPSSITSIGSSSIYTTGIKLIRIHSPTLSIGSYGCAYNYSAEKLEFDIDGTGTSYTFAGNAFNGSRGVTEVELPEGVTVVGQYMFGNCYSLQKVVLPSTTTEIGNGAFSYCYNLRDINLPSSISTIGTSVFSGCVNLKTIEWPSGCNTIKSSTFSDCTGLHEINIPNTVTRIEKAFTNTNIHSISIPNGAELASTFSGMRVLEEITFPQSWTCRQNSELYYKTRIRHGVFPGSQSAINTNAFNGCSCMEDVSFDPNWVSNIGWIGENAFRDCRSMKQFEIPSNVNLIQAAAFQNCESLREITLSSKVTSIGNNAFNGCASLGTITVEATTPATLGTTVFDNINSNFVISVPNGTLSTYQAASGWSTYASHMVERVA